MKASELRIGNWVYSDRYSTDIKVEEISTFGIKIDGDFFWESMSLIKPIKITEEWLSKFGFEEYTKGLLSHKHKYFNLSKTEGGYYYSPDGYHTTECLIKYVHQLQNLYFALTSEELVIK